MKKLTAWSQNFQQLTDKTAAGEAGAAVLLLGYMSPELTEKELVSARRAFRQAIEKGSEEAKRGLELATLCQLRLKAKAGDAGSAYRLGRLLQRSTPRGSFEETRGAYEIAAQHGHAKAAHQLGLLLEHRDPAAACDAFRVAANGGIADAAGRLGRILAFEVSPPRLEEAKSALEQAAKGGDEGALFNLALLLEKCWVPPDLTAACSAYRQYALAGNLDAGRNSIDAGINLGIIGSSQSRV